MNFIKITFLFLLIAWQSTAQDAIDPGNIDLGFSPEFIDFSPDDRYLVAENDSHYQVWDLETQTRILNGKHTFKPGRAIKSKVLPTGSGYFLFGTEQVFMTVDYQHNKTHVKAFSLKDGKMIWETDQLHMEVSLAETILRLHGEGIVTAEIVGKQVNPRHSFNSFFTPDKVLDRLINYLPERNTLFFNGKKGLQSVDINNGNINWTQKSVTGGIGEILFNPQAGQLYLIKVPNSEGSVDLLTAKPEVQALDVNTGKLLWSVPYTGDFTPGYASIVGHTLVLPYLDLTFIDVKNAVERNGDIKSRLGAARTSTKVLGGIMAIDKAINGGNSQAKTDSKYNRLIPRQLYFDANGKLCYFTIFNKKGKLGVGGKKGYLNIDIHKDKVEVEKYNILGDQWTVIQDQLEDGIFYIKSSGTLNRTMITAINPENGEILFQTDKARNSADRAKAFNPFLISNARIIDFVSKGIYTLDARTGQKIAYTTSRDLGVGTIKSSRFFEKGIYIFGTKGIGIMDFDGKIILNVEARNVKDVVANSNEVWILENNKFTRVNLQLAKITENITFKSRETMVFSPSGKYLLKVNKKGDKIKMYN
ncbi:hypothetical protein APR41_15955 [Salegentibacter salinarum]|uniref:Pyrrolo-quinoline quinone repeat domain-containing protein n=1 Tax=Salegentibacter salinarum TaxID=447422 RepID=A0A2N0TXH8_9FLAO|nr:PQQ-binding-like beta-propeller repeat protein [Salegentibacter salinarum]PKD19453.1 hypothetical protein APR41_15955 [Salegentibacter salinarum]SKB92111.1 hypothetical protein SAMN05660903_03272 [Salegentibacter salinarum]